MHLGMDGQRRLPAIHMFVAQQLSRSPQGPWSFDNSDSNTR